METREVSYPPPSTSVIGAGRQGTALLPRYPHKIKKGLARWWYPTSLTLIIFFLVMTVLMVIYDIVHQLYKSTRPSRVSDIIITFGTYVVMAIIAVTIIVSRVFKFRAMVKAIPKGYIPTKKEDLPKSAYELVSSEFDRVALITHVTEPKGRQLVGWGMEGSDHEGIHFRTAIKATPDVLRSVLPPHPYTGSRARPLSPLAPFLALRPSPIPAAMNPLAALYEEYLQRAQYGPEEPTKDDYDNVVKIVAVFVGLLGAKKIEQTKGEEAARDGGLKKEEGVV